MLNFILCDDNQNAIDRLSKMLNSIIIQNNLDGQLTFSSTNPTSILDYMSNNTVDAIILDIDLKNDISGLELAELIRKHNKNTYIIFITAHLEYGLIAYKYKTFDYISKPVTLERFESTILRLFDDAYGNKQKYIRLDNNKTIIPESSIKFIEKDGMKLLFNTDTRIYKVYNSFNKIEDKLPKHFIRCHKSYIVNLDKICNIDISSNTILFANNEKCYIGPKYKNKFMEVFNNEIFTSSVVGNIHTK